MTKDNLKLLDFQDSWIKIVDKGLGDFDSLTPEERIWFTVETLILQANNGGLISFYYNSYGERVHETIQDLETIGFADIANTLKEINKLFPNEEPSQDVDERNLAISSWPDGKYDKLFDALEETYNNRRDELVKTLIQHIITNQLNT